jgi:transcriptional regulator with XRE-family HTH domain
MDFWMRLKNEIKAQNTTQEWVAGKIGVPFGTFRKWMTRKTYPNIKEGIEIAKLLETSAEYLVTGDEPQGLNDIERKLMNNYRKLSSADRENVILAVNAWAGKNDVSSKHRK